MGKMVAFWSPVAGQGKVTASMVAIVSSLAQEKTEYEIAVTSVGKEETSLEAYLEEKRKWIKSEELYERSGVSALLLACKQGALTRDRIRRCALPLAVSGVALFPGLISKIRMIHAREAGRLEFYILTECLKREYDLAFIDLGGGFKETSIQYMKAADLVVVVLPQNPMAWQFFLKERGIFEEKKLFILFGGYLKNSRNSIAKFRRMYTGWEEKGSGAIPLSEGYMDALADGKAMEFFMRNEYAGKKDENYEFIQNTKRAAKRIREAVILS